MYSKPCDFCSETVEWEGDDREDAYTALRNHAWEHDENNPNATNVPKPKPGMCVRKETYGQYWNWCRYKIFLDDICEKHYLQDAKDLERKGLQEAYEILGLPYPYGTSFADAKKLFNEILQLIVKEK